MENSVNLEMNSHSDLLVLTRNDQLVLIISEPQAY